jgi:Arc/MetJ-type ribon-helix-helix transcriptional regulator
MKISVSLPVEDVEFLDDYAAAHALSSRSAAIHGAVSALRMSALAGAYGSAWEEWERSEDALLWDATLSDGV